MRIVDNIKVWGEPLENAVSQAVTCSQYGDVLGVALMADHHKGYSQPIGGVVAYRNMISPSGVGYDIACGNKAVRTNLMWDDIRNQIAEIMDDINSTISFGVGRNNPTPVDHELFDDASWKLLDTIEPGLQHKLKTLARNQLGTVGSGNHFVDIFVEEATGKVWIANHFGSRGFGHKVASGFLNLAAGREFSGKAPGESMDQPPTLFDLNSEMGDMYWDAMTLAGRYAYAGRDYVIEQVLGILGASAEYAVHNHHNFAWKEQHKGEEVVVVRKGATPLAPGQLGFVGGSMGDISVIVEGIHSEENTESFRSTVHGAGRTMSRTQAAGKMNYKLRTRMGGEISEAQMHEAIRAYGVELRGAGTDESPFVYKKLQDVLNAHANTLKINHVLRPVGVAMAGGNEFDPYKD
ncbi:RtcB family protein [Paenibacillus xylanexedens]|uniref:RtcB family protein n=1 Tax=Paenibacillus xylanexedens TaxID=528191 RepID=UPI0011A09944|nr:RtcB family protein [Paenibacillus xylanexedens]